MPHFTDLCSFCDEPAVGLQSLPDGSDPVPACGSCLEHAEAGELFEEGQAVEDRFLVIWCPTDRCWLLRGAKSGREYGRGATRQAAMDATAAILRDIESAYEDGCPVGDPDCMGSDESCHDACEEFVA